MTPGSQKLPNYLRTYRKRAGFTQEEEVAFLLCLRQGATISRYEWNTANPALETLIAYEVIFGVPLRELFAGTCQKVEKRTLKQAKSLTAKLQAEDPNRVSARKLVALNTLTDSRITTQSENK